MAVSLLLEPVGRDPVLMPAVGGLRPEASAPHAAQAKGVHESRDPLGGVPLAAPPQRDRQPRTAIGAAALPMQFAQFCRELGILAGTGARGHGAHAVVAAARDAEGRAQVPDPVSLLLQRLHARVALPDGSARIPKAFFKTSHRAW